MTCTIVLTVLLATAVLAIAAPGRSALPPPGDPLMAAPAEHPWWRILRPVPDILDARRDVPTGTSDPFMYQRKPALAPLLRFDALILTGPMLVPVTPAVGETGMMIPVQRRPGGPITWPAHRRQRQ
jgi:hypothetical protein